MKLMIAIPTLDYIHFEFAKSLAALVKKLSASGVDFEVCWLGRTLVYMSRNDLAADAVNRGFTHVLWLDTDMIFQDDLFDKLVRHGKAIVSGVYHARRPGYESCMFESIEPLRRVKKYPDHLFEIGACGFGCVLTEAQVLQAVYRRYGDCFTPTPEFGEDLAFCQRANICGFPIYCDPEIRAGHIGHIVVYPDMGKEA